MARKVSYSKADHEAKKEAQRAALGGDGVRVVGVNSGKPAGVATMAANGTAAAIQERLRDQIKKGQLSVHLLPEQVKESVGSDRVGEWEKDEAFEILRENIRVRGQTQPIRVRPVDPEWEPGDDDPMVIPKSAEFFVQSGRRRLAACRELGIKVLAVIASDVGILSEYGETPEKRAELSDLEERFVENTIRQSLSQLERMLSIGQIAERLKDEERLKQVGIAERLGVKQSDVSASFKLWRDWRAGGESRAWFAGDVSKRILRDYIPKLGTGLNTDDVLQEIAERGRGVQMDATSETPPAQEPMQEEGGETATPAQPRPKSTSKKHELFNGSSFAVARSVEGIKVTAKALAIPEDRQGDFERDLKALLERYQAT